MDSHSNDKSNSNSISNSFSTFNSDLMYIII